MRWLCILATLFLSAAAASADERCELQFDIQQVDGRPQPCRVHLWNEEEQPQMAFGLPFWKDHFACDGTAALRLPPGKYVYAIERGPEHQRLHGSVMLKPGRDVLLQAHLDRIADLPARGWYGGDLHVHRSPEDIERLMRAEDLHVAQVITWWNAKNLWADRTWPVEPLRQIDGQRFAHVLAGEDERGGGALLFHRLTKPLAITAAKREFPSSVEYALQARNASPAAWIDAEKPFWWDVPLWLGLDLVDSIGLANNHLQRSQMLVNEAWGKARDTNRLPDPLGNALWSQEIYYNVLNCGLRIPPSAGSASGVLANPVGYNRVYVQTRSPLNYDAWWDGLRAGRCFVTNGPLLLVRANGEPPGTVFQSQADQPVQLALEMELIGLDSVPELEILVNGDIVKTIPLEKTLTQRWTAKLEMPESGWFLVRAVADVPETFRFASTGPFYVEVGRQPRRISRRSVEFFADWLHERQARVNRVVTNEAEWDATRKYFEAATEFWDDRLRAANAE
jgi:hypothetical protein